MDTPYNGAEGGYLYIHGGPYTAEDELYRRFGVSSYKLIRREHYQVVLRFLEDWRTVLGIVAARNSRQRNSRLGAVD